MFPRLSHLWLDAGYRAADKGKVWAMRRPWGGARIWWSVPESLLPKRCSDGLGQGVGQRKCGARLAEAHATPSVRSAAASVGSVADVFMD
jgi:hypothetical protein